MEHVNLHLTILIFDLIVIERKLANLYVVHANSFHKEEEKIFSIAWIELSLTTQILTKNSPTQSMHLFQWLKYCKQKW